MDGGEFMVLRRTRSKRHAKSAYDTARNPNFFKVCASRRTVTSRLHASLMASARVVQWQAALVARIAKRLKSG